VHRDSVTVDPARADVQHRLLEAWASTRPGSTTPHVVVNLPSYSLDETVLTHYGPRIPALEQRYLCEILALQDPSARLVYLSSKQVPQYLVDYYRALIPDLDDVDLDRRLLLLSVDDPSPRPLSQKLLARPDLLAQVREFVGDDPAYVDPWNVTVSERDVALALDVPLFGADPGLWELGNKSNGRRLMAEEGVSLPPGREDLRSFSDLVTAAVVLRHGYPRIHSAVVKLNNSAAGDGNAVLDLSGLSTSGTLGERLAVKRRLYALPGWFVWALEAQGGILEEWIEGPGFCSPSVQVAIDPQGGVEVLGTHDQILGGHSGQVYEGCRFPAGPGYAPQVAESGLAVGRRLAKEGFVGQLAVDFAAVQDGSGWQVYALEINLRKGGTTHPLATAGLLLHGRYDAEHGRYRDETGQERVYVASDNVLDPRWTTLDPRDVIRRVHEAGLAYDLRRRTGVVLHMLECLPVDGRFGLTAFGASRDEAQALYDAVPRLL
jgi:hypothetical protein